VAHDDDEAWRSIVDNYGDRPDLDDPPAGSAGSDGPASGIDDAPDRADRAERRTEREDPFEGPEWDEDRFVPPPPPPLPTTTTDRMAAWCGLFGAPAVLLLTLVLGIRLPEIVNYALVLGFVGGFLYLVVKMNREPRDPDDNGAVL